jgi:hypothetical protein
VPKWRSSSSIVTARGDHGDRDDQQQRGGHDRPDEQRQSRPGHAGRAHVDDRGHEVDRAQQGGEAGEVDEVDPGVDAAGRRVGNLRQWHRRDPAGRGRGPEDRCVEDDAARQKKPEGERVQARKRHVARADHQRHEVVGKAYEHRHDEEEDHRRAVHREQRVVDLRRDQAVVRLAQLQAHHQRFYTADDEEHERRDHVEDPDPLVVGRRQPAHQAVRLALDAVDDDLRDGGDGCRGHRRSL